jgi:hypothetical protein
MNSIMKSFSVLALSATIASPALASKARLGAMQGALGLIDTQTIFYNSAYVNKLPQLATFEFGSSANTGAPKAEGGFLIDRGARWGAYLGHQSGYQNAFRTAGGQTFPLQDNPIDIFWGNGDMGASISLSNSEDATTSAKQTTLIARYGMIMGEHEFSVNVDLFGKAENTPATTADKVASKLPMIEGNYLLRQGDMTYAATVAYGDADLEVSGASNTVKQTGVSLGANHRPIEGIYYGALFNWAEFDVAGKKRTAYNLPFVLGLEKEVTTWMIVRGSVKQNVLLSSIKDDIAAAKEKKNLNDTVVAFGTGFKQGNFLLDALFSASSSGKINGSDFLSQASVTYNF